MTWSKVYCRLDPNLVLVVLLSIFAFAPLTHPAFFQSHSGFLPVFNLYDLEGDLWGNWGWTPHVATGPDIIRGDGPLPYLLAELPRWLGMGGEQAIKGTTQAQFQVLADGKLEQITVFPSAALEVGEIEDSYGKSCSAVEKTGVNTPNCYHKQLTDDFRTYYWYKRLGVVVFFGDDKKSVFSITYLAPTGPGATASSDGK